MARKRSPAPARVSMRGIAERAGVSPMTVSYILRGRTDLFRPETCAKVQAIIQEMGYVPSRSPRAMRTGQHGAIAFVGTRASPEDVSWYSKLMLEGLADAAATHELDLIYSKLQADESKPRLLREANVDGLIINAISYLPDALVDQLAQRYPLVMVNENRAQDAVYPDEEAAGRLAASWLLQQGHKELAFIAFWLDAGHFSFQARRRGFLAVCREAGATVHVLKSAGPDVSILGAEQLQQTRAFLANHAATGVCGLGAREAACIIDGWPTTTPPGDVVVFSERMVELGNRIVATVIIPYRELGLQAVAMLTEKIKSPGPRAAITVPVTNIRGAPRSLS